MNYKAVILIVAFLMLTGCAVRKEPVSTREPKSLITKDDYGDLKVTPPKDEPAEIDYTKGMLAQSIDTAPKVSPEEDIQNKFLYIASFGSVDELKLRYENGGKVNFRNKDGETVLIKALEGTYNNQTLLKLEFLVSVGANVNFKGKSKTSKSTTPLDAAVWSSSSVFKSGSASQSPFFAEQVLNYLVDAGADISDSDEYGRTPLHTASRSDNLFAAQLLLKSGAAIMQKDYYGRTPLNLAKSRDMERILKEYGAVETEDPFPDFDRRKDEIEPGGKPQEVWEPLRGSKPF